MSKQQHPFIYISALMRTGSTVLSEALTQHPHSFIFREPYMGKNSFSLKPGDVERFAEFGIDLQRFFNHHLRIAFLLRRLRPFGYRQDYIIHTFKTKLLPQVQLHYAQVGAKEIRHEGWQNYLRHFPDMKIVMTGRDPRDIYISTHHRWQRGLMHKRYPIITPAIIVTDLTQQFQLQLALKDAASDYCRVRYEDLCTDPAQIDQVKQFVKSPITVINEVGHFNANHPKRTDEYALHGDTITTQRVNRWQKEDNKQLLTEAQEVFDRMIEYCDFWGYTKSGEI